MNEDPAADTPQRVLDFWFGAAGEPDADLPRKVWFEVDPAFDRRCREQFAQLHASARAHALDHWQANASGCLALVILLDQLSRNMFRGTPQAFAQDPQALAIAQHALTQGFDRQVPPLRRMFLYLPFEHSEDLAMQARSVELFETLRGDPYLDRTIEFAHRHYEVIARFGRFPHRNAILGRTSSSEELEYLRSPGAGF